MSVFELPTVTLIPNGIHHPPIEDGRLLPNSVKSGLVKTSAFTVKVSDGLPNDHHLTPYSQRQTIEQDSAIDSGGDLVEEPTDKPENENKPEVPPTENPDGEQKPEIEPEKNPIQKLNQSQTINQNLK